MKVTSVPLQTIQFTQEARLVPTDSLDLERRKTMARFFAFQARCGKGDSMDLKYVNQVNKAFSPGLRQASVPVPNDAAVVKQKVSMTGVSFSPHAASLKPSPPAPSVSGSGRGYFKAARFKTASETRIPEPQATYTMQRGSFEMRVAKGELSYIPPLVMTIITQYPEVRFEYTGEDYPRQESGLSEANVDLSI